MKIANAQIDSYISSIDKEKIAGALIYGPCGSVGTSRFNYIAKKIVANLSDQFLVSHLTKERFAQQSSCLDDEFYSFSMLGGRKLIIVQEPSTEAVQSLKDLLKNEESVAKSENFILVQAGDLEKSSSLRKLSETSNLFASIACYEDNDITTRKFIEQQLARNGLQSGFNISQHIFELLGKNRQVIAAEINKIATYLDKKEITIEAIDLAIKGQAEIPFDNFVNAFVAKNKASALKSAEFLLNNGFEAIMLIRFLSNYVQKLYHAKMAVEAEEISFEEAVKKQRLFFKVEDEFRKNLKSTSLADLKSWLNLLMLIEIKIKSSTKLSPKILFFAFLQDSF